MKTPTMDLIEEHGGIMLMLSIMKKVAEKLRAGEEVSKKHLDMILEFLVNFADKCHHGKEEDVLFPELFKNPSNQELVTELIDEHKTGREYIKDMVDSGDLAGNFYGDDRGGGRIRQTIRNFENPRRSIV